MHTDNMRSYIIDVAEKVIQDKGLYDTRTDDIAKAAGISKGCIFYHFPSKKEVLLGIVTRYERILYGLRDQIFAELPDQPMRHFKALILALIEHPNPLISNTIAMLSDGEIRHIINKMKARLMEELLTDAPDEKTATRILVIFDGIWLSKVFEDRIYSPEVVEEILGDVVGSLSISRSQLA